MSVGHICTLKSRRCGEGVRSAGHLNVTAEFLLAPEECDQMTTDAAVMVSRAVFKYIRMTKRLL